MRAPIVSAEAAVEAIAAKARGQRVFVPGSLGEAADLIAAWRAAPDLAGDLLFCGMFVPGLNRTDYSALAPTARMETILMAPELRAGFEAGRVISVPLGYLAAYRRLCALSYGASVISVTPGANGGFSLGVCADSGLAGFANSGLRIGLLNHAAPLIADPARAPCLPADAFDLIVETHTPLLSAPPEASGGVIEAVAANAAALIEAGDALQFGIGKLPAAILALVRDRRGLRIRSGMYVDAVLDLIDAGAIAETPDAMLAGVPIGAAALAHRLAQDPRARFQPVSETHNPVKLAATPRLKALNGALEVDLFGTVNSEFVNGKLVSGLGGLGDFAAAASLSEGGRAIIALPSTAGKDGPSRIVPRLGSPTATLARPLAHTVVTEHGIAHIAGLSLDDRAQALIAIAAPACRDALGAAWTAIRKGL